LFVCFFVMVKWDSLLFGLSRLSDFVVHFLLFGGDGPPAKPPHGMQPYSLLLS
jgi:hypothetical protein